MIQNNCIGYSATVDYRLKCLVNFSAEETRCDGKVTDLTITAGPSQSNLRQRQTGYE